VREKARYDYKAFYHIANTDPLLQLIDAMTGSYAEGIYNSLSPHDMNICSVPVQLPGIDDEKSRVHLIDTPGIDNSKKTMDAVLKEPPDSNYSVAKRT